MIGMVPPAWYALPDPVSPAHMTPTERIQGGPEPLDRTFGGPLPPDLNDQLSPASPLPTCADRRGVEVQLGPSRRERHAEVSVGQWQSHQVHLQQRGGYRTVGSEGEYQ